MGWGDGTFQTGVVQRCEYTTNLGVAHFKWAHRVACELGLLKLRKNNEASHGPRGNLGQVIPTGLPAVVQDRGHSQRGAERLPVPCRIPTRRQVPGGGLEFFATTPRGTGPVFAGQSLETPACWQREFRAGPPHVPGLDPTGAHTAVARGLEPNSKATRRTVGGHNRGVGVQWSAVDVRRAGGPVLPKLPHRGSC